ncbi:MAG TPA: hypothetical protein VN253_01775, partial [Kofleriaceae bacterium]|nr:hypothetical protein [Kofleriaceae bacterium]
MRRDPRSPSELLAAYVDGVSELPAGERRALEERLADDEALRAEAAETRGLIGKLRELPRDGGEPDWAVLERSICDAVGAEVPRSWWRRFGWRWVVPGMALAATAAVAALVLHAPAREAGPAPAPVPSLAGRDRAPPAEAPRGED